MMKGILVEVDEFDKVLATKLTSIGLHFYDEDGDGSFETLKLASLYPEIPSLPEWVRVSNKSD